MAPIIDFTLSLVSAIIQLLVWALIINAIMSWLIAFDVINLRNRFVYQVSRMLDRITRPVLAPIQRFVPPLGGIDITPVLAILVLSLANSKLLQPLKYYLMGLVG